MERYVINQNGDGVEEPPIARMVSVTILKAVQEHANEIIVEATAEHTAVRFHIGEQWYEIMTLPTFAHVPMLQRVKELAAIDQAAPVPQQGMINLQVNQQNYDAQTSITPGAYGEMIALKITNVGDRRS